MIKSYIISLIGMSIIGISIGYVVGFNVHKFFIVNYLSYLPVFIMGVGCAIMIYVALFLNERK